MSAESIDIVTLALQNPEFFDTSEQRWTELPANLSFQYTLSDSIRTLSTTGAPSNDDISGLIYVPTLSSAQQSACPQASNATWIPKNATHRANLPVNYQLIALAPWLNQDCTLAFLDAASNDLLAAMLFYLPPAKSNASEISSNLVSTGLGTGNGTAEPPLATDPVWNLDGGAWKNRYNFPVYAVPADLGVLWMQQISLYSGNMTEVPDGKELAEMGLAGPTDYVRLMADISTGGGGHIPSLWVFLLIVLALLILIIALTSGFMHFVARQRRSMLRRRIANGEIDLEALGIKRLMVPKEVLDKMPLYAYAAAPEPAVTRERQSSNTTSNSKSLAKETVSVLSRPNTNRTAPHNRASAHLEAQTTCAICLDDFDATTPSPSMVRELPCGHIFHAECVDPFLTTHSSLCPLCKKSSLPVGYVPKTITNTMVRRERQVRRLRGRGFSVGNGGSEDIVRASILAGREDRSLVERLADGRIHLPPRLQHAIANGRRVFSSTTPSTGSAAREMQEIPPPASVESPAPVTAASATPAPVELAAEDSTPRQPETHTEEPETEQVEQVVREGPSAAIPVPLQPVASEAESSTQGAKSGLRALAGKLFPKSG